MSTESGAGKDGVALDYVTSFKKFLAGGISAGVAVTVVAPLERTKLILQIQDQQNTGIPPHKRYKGIIDCLVRIPKEQGFLSFWRGNTASVVRCFPYHAFNFLLKDVFHEIAVSKLHPQTVPGLMFLNLVTGGLAGASALSIIYPLDYARTRLALDLGRCKNTREFRTIRDCIADAYHTNGIRGLYKGYGVSVFGVMVYRSAYFGIYDSGTEIIPEHLHTLWMQFLLAETSAVTAGLLSFPIDTVRRTLMMQSGRKSQGAVHQTTLQCARGIYKTNGISGFFRGCLANVMRGTGGAIMLILYDYLNYFMIGEKGHNFQTPQVQHKEPEKGDSTSSKNISFCNF